jgi:hypothetical protein
MQMAELLSLEADGDRFVIAFRDGNGTFNVSLSAQTASTLIASLAQAIVDRADANRLATEWLKWPTTARSGEVSFDVDSIGPGAVGMAVKLPGLLPITVEIPLESARQVAFALTEAANKSQIPEIGKT